MTNLKHVGKYIPTGRKCVVAYRTIPGDAYNCLIITTENLEESYHDSLLRVVESAAAQESYELAEALTRSQFPDGSTMLAKLHATGRLVKVPTDAVEMTPSIGVSINLAELNQIIAEQRGIAVDDLAIKPDVADKQPEAEVADIVQVSDLIRPAKEQAQSSNAALESQVEQLSAQVAQLTQLVAQLTTAQQAIRAVPAETSNTASSEAVQYAEAAPVAKSTRKAAK